ncbi:MAG TPA: sulfatase-like hydrolase/transferase [Terriglobales bacterium]|nr:sulfatase-like hydrolase/transferase [Terriglobales bacterium]
MAAGLPLPSMASQPRRPRHPNVLLIITDQQRTDTLGYRRLTPCRTPNLDHLAAEGASFDRCLTPTPICLPARTALFTSQYGHQTETVRNTDTLTAEPILLTRLKANGYQVDYAGKWGMGKSIPSGWVDRAEANDTAEYSRWCAEQGLEDGWAFNDPKMHSRREDVSSPATAVSSLKPEQTNEAWTVDHAIKLLNTRDRNRPFFLTCAFQGPHPPFKIPEPYYSMYDPASIPEPKNFGPTPGEPAALSRSFYRTVWRDHGTSWGAWRKSVAVYWGFVTMIDAQIGRLVERLRSEGILDETLVVMTADHGELMGSHGLWMKYQAYEESLRVPLIIRAPWLFKPGLRTRTPSSLIDIAPTVLAACGVASPAAVQGVDLFSSTRSGGPRLLFSEFTPKADWHGVVDWRLVTDDHYKYVWNQGDIDECYDLSVDPYELTNLARTTAKKAVLRRLQGELRDWMRRTRDPLLADFQRSLANAAA